MPTGLTVGGDAASFLALLFAGHFLGDFAFQSDRMAQRKGRLSVLLAHAGVVTLVHLVVLLPYLGVGTALAVVVLGASHAAIDGVKSRLETTGGSSLQLVLGDQFAHLVVLLGVFTVLTSVGPPILSRMPSEWSRTWELGMVLLAGLAFNWNGGAALVSGLLATLSPSLEEEEDSGVQGSGRLIGGLERTIALVLILMGQWAAMVLLVAAKSIARFEELKERSFAEYYLVGTLASLLVAILVGLVLTVVLQRQV